MSEPVTKDEAFAGWGTLFMPVQADQRILAQRILRWAQRGECVLCGQELPEGFTKIGDETLTFDHLRPRVERGGDMVVCVPSLEPCARPTHFAS